MEQDRYQKNHILYIVGLIALVIGLGLLAFTLYITPHMLAGWTYDIPGFISTWIEWLRVRAHMNGSAASQLIVLFLFLATISCVLIAYYTSNRLDNQIFSAELQSYDKPERVTTNRHEAIRLVLILLSFVLLIYMLAELFLWLIK